MMTDAKSGFSEAPIDPDMPIIDAHHHLIHRGSHRYLFHEYLHDAMGGHNIRASVYVESRQMYKASGPEHLKAIGEVEFANGAAAMGASDTYGSCRVNAGIVGFADLRLGDRLEEVLDGHERAGGGRFRGIRFTTFHDDADDYMEFTSQTSKQPKALLLDAQFQDGIRRLGRRGLTYDAIIFQHQLPELAAAARACPDTIFVLNHMCFALGIGRYAARRAEVFEEWKRGLAEAAKCPNIVVKTGGMGIPFWGFDFHKRPNLTPSTELAAAWAPYFNTCIEVFGPDRCMMESNFPADARGCDFVSLWNALKRIAAQYSPSEKTALFSGTAARIYKIEREPATH